VRFFPPDAAARLLSEPRRLHVLQKLLPALRAAFALT